MSTVEHPHNEENCEYVSVEQILDEYRRRQMIEHLTGPTISALVHVAVVVALAFFMIGENEKEASALAFEVVEVEIKSFEPDQEREFEEIIEQETETFPQVDTPEVPPETDVVETAEILNPLSDFQATVDVGALDVKLTRSRLVIPGLLGGRKGGNGSGPGGSEATKSINAVVDQGLAWLASKQKADGNWPYDAHPNAVNGAAALAFLGRGHSTQGGKYREVIEKFVDFYVKRLPPDGGVGNHGHATPFVVMAMCDALAMDPANDKLREFCEKSIDYALRTQHNDGGWSGGAHSTPKNSRTIDVPATGWWVMALVSAQLAGIDVPESAIEKARNVLKDVGRDRYRGEVWYTNHGGLEVSYDTEAGQKSYVATMAQFLGVPRDDRLIQNLSREVVRNIPPEGKRNYWLLYNQGLGLFQLGKDSPEWQKFKKLMLDDLMNNKKEAGNGVYWDNSAAFKHDRKRPPGATGNTKHWGNVGTTAMAVLNLEVFYRYGDVHALYREYGTLAAPESPEGTQNAMDFGDEDLGIEL